MANCFIGNYGPDADQLVCINAVEGIYNVVAGPGSGKTATLLQRWVNMLMNGIDPKTTLNVTFTHEAAEEMVKRLGFADTASIFRTFHSYALELVRKERAYLPFKTTDDVLPFSGEDYQLLFELVKTYRAGVKNFRTLKDRIVEWKCADISPERAIDESLGMERYYGMAYRDYERKCREQGWLDFDSLMHETVDLLERNDDVRQRWQREYIAVDECQDTNVLQFRLLQLLFKKNIFAVGDENQLVYEWRNAQAGSLSNFELKFPGSKKLYLGRNYRSTGAIVKFLKRILPVDNGLGSRMMTTNPYGEDPSIVRYGDELEEAQQIIALIKEPGKTAILARTNRQLFEYQKILTKQGQKYRILGKKDYWEQNEVKSLLRLAKDDLSLRPAHEVLASIIERERMFEKYRYAQNPMESSPVENLNDIVKMAATESRSKTGEVKWSGRGSVSEFLAYLRRLTYGRKGKQGEAITLATVHQAKGHEWDYVYVIGVNQKKMPHKDGELPEERRIFYVAASRPAKELHFSYTGQRSQFWPEEYPSFIYTKPEEVCPSA
jgi:DNA helicase II / ATP-dependent DNA helicase PcrA